MPNSMPLEVVLNVDLPAELVEQLRAGFPDARFTSQQELARAPDRLAHCEVLFTQRSSPEEIAAAKQLRWIQSYGAGVEKLLTPELLARESLQITNTRGIHAQPIAEHVFGLLLAHVRRIDGSVRQQERRHWDAASLGPVRTLDGATLGVIGLGTIGRRLALVAKSFGMRVIGTRKSAKPTPHVDETLGADGLHKVLANAEYVVNALPDTAETKKVFDRAAFAQLRPDAVFVNIGRGAQVDTDAMVRALQKGRLGAALLDVTDPEPLPTEHPLWTLPNVIITPHYAGAHPGYARHATAIFAENLRRYLKDEPLKNLVDKQAGY